MTDTLRGLGTAFITPFLPSGEVDYPAIERLLDRQISAKVDYIVVLGTTGEAVTLSTDERKEVRQFISHYVARRLPLVLGVGGNCTRDVIAQLNEWRDELQHDYTAILSVCPYYNKPSQEGLCQHFTAIANASPVPVILYNVPGRTGVNLLPETVVRIWQTCPEKVIGIKEASGNLEQIQRIISHTQSNNSTAHPFLVISGDDGIAADVMKMGGAGLISVASNAWPEQYRKIVHEKDLCLQTQFAEAVRLLFAEGNPCGIKTVLHKMGLIHNILRLPLVPNSSSVQMEIEKMIAEDTLK